MPKSKGMPRPVAKTMLVIDDFLADPDAMVSEARQRTFVVRPEDPSICTSPGSTFHAALKRKVAQIAAVRVEWDRHSGSYRKTTRARIERTKSEWIVHSDYAFDVVALLYLNDSATCHGGTGFFRHKETGLEGFHDLAAVARVMERRRLDKTELLARIDADARHGDRWEQTDLLQMKHNRMVVYNGRRFHSHVLAWDSAKRTSARLTFNMWGRSA